MKYVSIGFFLTLLCFACNDQKKETRDNSQYFPIRSFLQSQVKSLDTASYTFIKIETINGKSDTSVVTKEELKKYTQEFTDIPDLRSSDEGSHYSETKSFDSLMGRVFMSYTSEDEDLEVVKQEITVLPTLTGSDEVKTIYIEKLVPTKDGTIDKVHKLKVVFQKNSSN
jgi:hypothetical protein